MPDLGSVEYLVVDTSAFIKNIQLQGRGTNIVTVQAVVDEILNKRQLRNLVVLPYELQIKDVFPEDIKHVTEFSKKTGDYPSLSATDIQVMALTYRLEKEKVGTEHLKKEPVVNRIVNFRSHLDEGYKGIVGFYQPPEKNGGVLESIETTDKETFIIEDKIQLTSTKNGILNKSMYSECTCLRDEEHGNDDDEKEAVLELKETSDKEKYVTGEKVQTNFELKGGTEFTPTDEKSIRQVILEDKLINVHELKPLIPLGDDDDGDEEEDEEDSDEMDDSDWITPSNIAQVKQEMPSDVGVSDTVVVACITDDFAMQNVLKQMGLQVLSVTGHIIQQLRTFILRCYSCFKTTSVMTKVFCPHCGNRTLKRVAVSLHEDGTQEIHLSARKRITGRGKRFSLPKPQGGKHANNPILCEDQRIPHQRPSRLARTKTDPLDPDYIAGFSPFVMRDVTSRAAMLGIRNVEVKNWMRKNPNEVLKKGRKKKK